MRAPNKGNPRFIDSRPAFQFHRCDHMTKTHLVEPLARVCVHLWRLARVCPASAADSCLDPARKHSVLHASQTKEK